MRIKFDGNEAVVNNIVENGVSEQCGSSGMPEIGAVTV